MIVAGALSVGEYILPQCCSGNDCQLTRVCVDYLAIISVSTFATKLFIRQCSVCSGLLCENICFECGALTNPEDWDSLIICDTCEGEYHTLCVCPDGRVPRTKFECARCKEERDAFKDLKFHVHENFKVAEVHC